MNRLILHQKRKWSWLAMTVTLIFFLVSYAMVNYDPDDILSIGNHFCCGSVVNKLRFQRPNPYRRDVGNASPGQRINTDETGEEVVKPAARTLLPLDEELSARRGHCNLNDGVWEYDDADLLYTNETCSLIQDEMNCIRNGRPDSKYLHWRWKPRACDLPRFDAEKFLRTFRGKTIGYVGDSIARNQMLSLLCLLSQAEKPVVVYESYYHKKFNFERSQVTLMVAWAPFLVKQAKEPVQVRGLNIIRVLHMDELEPEWTTKLDEMDIVTVSIGQWYLAPMLYLRAGGTEVLGCAKCSGNEAANESEVVEILNVFRATLRSGLERLAFSEKVRVVVVTTFNPQHYESGGWHTGTCERTDPLQPEQAGRYGWLNDEMRNVVFDELTRVLDLQGEIDGGSLVSFDFIDITKVMLLRADGHSGPYRIPHPFAHLDRSNWVQNDCVHWCMPGPVDTWNEMLFQILRRYLQ